MEKEFTPQQGFDLINKIIDQRRISYEENGTNILIWGIITMVTAIGQYVLIYTGFGQMSGLIWALTMIPLFVYTAYDGFRKNKALTSKGANKGSWDVAGMTWFLSGVMAMLTGFIFRKHFGSAFTTVMFLPFCMAALTTAISLKRKTFVILVLIALVVCYVALYIPDLYHPLIVASLAFLLFFLPGLMLVRDNKKRQHV